LIPTRFIEQPEFIELMALEGSSYPVYKLSAIPFDPPIPGHEDPDWNNYATVRILMLNVLEPRLYRDLNNVIFVVLPSFDVVTYDVASDAHPSHGAWCYRFSTYTYGLDDDMSEATFLFNEKVLPPFDVEEIYTH